MRAPSADHSNPVTAVSLLVSCTASPPSGRIAKIWFLSPTRALVNPIHWLSGDHCALPDDFGPRVSCTGAPPAAGTTQSCVTNASCSKSVSVTP